MKNLEFEGNNQNKFTYINTFLSNNLEDGRNGHIEKQHGYRHLKNQRQIINSQCLQTFPMNGSTKSDNNLVPTYRDLKNGPHLML
jgi:hypothetical protein